MPVKAERALFRQCGQTRTPPPDKGAREAPEATSSNSSADFHRHWHVFNQRLENRGGAASEKLVTIPNYISVLRILLVPVFVALVVYYVNRGTDAYRYGAILVFAIAAISDALDGYLARRLNQTSRLGAILDPLADKLLLVSGVVVLSLDYRPTLPTVPIWLTTLIISRDVILPLGTILISYTGTRPQVKARMLGKLATIAQMALILWALLKAPHVGLVTLIILSGLLTAGSGIQYVLDGIAQLDSPSTASNRTQKTDKSSDRETS